MSRTTLKRKIARLITVDWYTECMHGREINVCCFVLRPRTIMYSTAWTPSSVLLYLIEHHLIHDGKNRYAQKLRVNFNFQVVKTSSFFLPLLFTCITSLTLSSAEHFVCEKWQQNVPMSVDYVRVCQRTRTQTFLQSPGTGVARLPFRKRPRPWSVIVQV